MNPQARLLSVAEVADWLSVSPRTVYILLERGDLIGYRPLPRTTRVEAASVRSLLRSSQLGPDPEAEPEWDEEEANEVREECSGEVADEGATHFDGEESGPVGEYSTNRNDPGPEAD